MNQKGLAPVLVHVPPLLQEPHLCRGSASAIYHHHWLVWQQDPELCLIHSKCGGAMRSHELSGNLQSSFWHPEWSSHQRVGDLKSWIGYLDQIIRFREQLVLLCKLRDTLTQWQRFETFLVRWLELSSGLFREPPYRLPPPCVENLVDK